MTFVVVVESHHAGVLTGGLRADARVSGRRDRTALAVLAQTAVARHATLAHHVSGRVGLLLHLEQRFLVRMFVRKLTECASCTLNLRLAQIIRLLVSR